MGHPRLEPAEPVWDPAIASSGLICWAKNPAPTEFSCNLHSCVFFLETFLGSQSAVWSNLSLDNLVPSPLWAFSILITKMNSGTRRPPRAVPPKPNQLLVLPLYRTVTRLTLFQPWALCSFWIKEFSYVVCGGEPHQVPSFQNSVNISWYLYFRVTTVAMFKLNLWKHSWIDDGTQWVTYTLTEAREGPAACRTKLGEYEGWRPSVWNCRSGHHYNHCYRYKSGPWGEFLVSVINL